MNGFFSSSPVHTALWAGLLVAVVSGPVGVFTILRSQSFAGHSLSDIGAAGGAGAYLAGVNVLYGFVSVNLRAAAVMEGAGGGGGAPRARQRDVATGIVLGAALGLSALFLRLQTASTTTGATVKVLFGSLFTLGSTSVPLIAALAGVALAMVGALYRPLLLSSVSPDLAAARGVPVGVVGAAYLVALACAVSLSSVTIGAVLSTALLIGPAAVALRVCRRPGPAVGMAVLVGVVATWGGVVLAYASYHWPPAGRGWPVSFFVVAIVLAFYGASASVTRD